MNVLIHLLVVLSTFMLLPSDPTIEQVILFVLSNLMIVFLMVRSYKEGLEKGGHIVWTVLGQTLHSRGIESIMIKKRAPEKRTFDDPSP